MKYLRFWRIASFFSPMDARLMAARLRIRTSECLKKRFATRRNNSSSFETPRITKGARFFSRRAPLEH